MKTVWLALALLCLGSRAAAGPTTPLFAADQPLRITLKGPISTIVTKRDSVPRAGMLTLTGTAETYPINLTARGLTRKQSDTCDFPPLRVELTQKPPETSVFAHQHRLKLVTHCQKQESFQQKVLLEYAAYRMLNLLTPQSFRARLVNVDYVNDDGRPYISRVGFVLEDADDMAKRNDLFEAKLGDRVAVSQLEPRSAARFALFNYMVGNLDWSMRAGPTGQPCCHNGRLLATNKTGAGPLVAVPYDFDYSGLVDAPYALPPEVFQINSVRDRVYRGYCIHMNDAQALAAEMSRRRGEIVGVLSSVPGMDERTRTNAASYLAGFFRDLDNGKALKNCVQ